MDVTDGKYVGALTPEQTISQLKYRAGIHEMYIELLKEDKEQWIGYGDEQFHKWAINGYEWAIHYIENNTTVNRCTIADIIKAIFSFIRR